MDLTELLRRVADTYDDLEDALVRTGVHPLAGGDAGGGGTQVEAPAPANLDVIEHRHRLVKGLRWWLVDRAPTRATQSVRGMCAYLATYPTALTEAERDQLAANLSDWLAASWPFLGKSDPPRTAIALSGEALEQRVRVADAAALLGCTVRTIQNRVPVAARAGGEVRLYDALPTCRRCDLKVGGGCGCVQSARSSACRSA